LRLVTEGKVEEMKKQPELLVAPQNLAELNALAEAGADGFVVGSEQFMMCGRGSFDHVELVQAVERVHQLGKKIYLAVDALLPNRLLAELEVYLTSIRDLPFDGIRYADLGAYMLIKDMLPQASLHFVDQMMLTNYETINYWLARGVSRVKMAPELTLDEVLTIKKEISGKAEVLIHGAVMMFTSRRKLVDNYLTFQKRMGKGIQLSAGDNHLFDSERQLYYPIVENEHGTHIFSGHDVCMIDELKDLLVAGIDVLYIEGFTYQTEQLVKVVQLYKMAIELARVEPKKYEKVGMALYAEVEKQQSENRRLDRGFYYKPTIYKNQTRLYGTASK